MRHLRHTRLKRTDNLELRPGCAATDLSKFEISSRVWSFWLVEKRNKQKYFMESAPTTSFFPHPPESFLQLQRTLDLPCSGSSGSCSFATGMYHRLRLMPEWSCCTKDTMDAMLAVAIATGSYRYCNTIAWDGSALPWTKSWESSRVHWELGSGSWELGAGRDSLPTRVVSQASLCPWVQESMGVHGSPCYGMGVSNPASSSAANGSPQKKSLIHHV